MLIQINAEIITSQIQRPMLANLVIWRVRYVMGLQMRFLILARADTTIMLQELYVIQHVPRVIWRTE